MLLRKKKKKWNFGSKKEEIRKTDGLAVKLKTYGVIKDKTDQPTRGYKSLCVLTSLGLVSLRNVLRSPPAISSSRMKRGRACKLTPIHRTMFWWLNLLPNEIAGQNTYCFFFFFIKITLCWTHVCFWEYVYLIMSASIRKSSSSCSEHTSGSVWLDTTEITSDHYHPVFYPKSML